MTKSYRKAAARRREHLRELALPLLGTALMILFLISSGVASEAVVKALDVGVGSVIPSVFPCMVLSKFIVAMRGDRLFSGLFGRPTELIFGLSRSAATPIVIGAFCGSPLGAVAASELYLRGELTRGELERMIGFVSLPSPAFVINAVGVSMLGDRSAGILLYFLLLTVSFLIGAVICRLGKAEEKGLLHIPRESKDLSISDAAVEAIGSSALASLKLCAYIAFFSAMTAVIGRLLDPTPVVSTLIGGFLEFSSGCFAAARLGTTASLPICALILGWSGLGVHFQVMSVCPKGISYKYFYLTLALRAFLCFCVAWFVK